jgi:hypothetical protein
VKRFLVIAIVAFAMGASATAAESRAAKVRRLMEAQGLLQTFEQQIESGREQGRKQANDMLTQVLISLNPNEAYKKKLHAAVDKFIDELQPPWGATEIVEAWAQSYGSSFSDMELDQLIAFYTSSLGQKEVLSSRRALTDFAKGFEVKYKPIRDRATANYMRDMQAVVRDCNCKK